jgi:hypothetical protein
MRLRLLDHLGRPDHAAAGIVAAEDRHDHPVIGADVLEAPEDAGGDVEDVALLQHDAPALPQRPQKKRQRPDRTKNTSAVRWECSEFRHLGGWPAAPMLKPWGSVMCTC